VWNPGCKAAQFFKRLMDLVLRLSALRQVQLNRGAGQTAVGPPRNRHYDFQITTQFHHGRRGRTHCTLSLRLQKQLRIIQKPIANRRRSCPPGCV
jgi:hypothetical protein